MHNRPFVARRITRRGAITSIAAFAIAGSRHTTLAQDATPAASPTAPTSTLGWSDTFADDGQLNVATTVAPISSIVRNVAGNRIHLHGIIPDGVDSHTYEPAPSDAEILSKADLILLNGLDLEDPTKEMANADMKSGAVLYELGPNTITPDQYQYDFSFPKSGGKPNPHLWMNVPFALNYAKLANQQLAALDAANADYYANNLNLYSAVLTKLDAGIAASVQTIPEQNRKLLTYHDSFAYFAAHYGMTVIGAVQPSDFSEPSPKEVAALIDQIKQEQIPAVFGSEVFPSDVLKQIADESGAVYIDKMRDDEPPGPVGSIQHTYVGLMLNDMQLMIPALGGNVDALAGIEPWDTWVQ